MISGPIFRATWRELLRSPIRMVMVVLFLLPSLFTALFGKPELPSSGDGMWFAAILGAGVIGRPAANGTLALVLSRPIRRRDYVLTRWLAVASLASALALLRLLAPTIAAHPDAAGLGHVGFAAAEDVLGAAGLAAVLTLLSALVGGLGDVAILAILGVVSLMLKGAGGFLAKPALTLIGTHLAEILLPRLDLETVFRSTPIEWLPLVVYLSTLTLCLALAAELLCRREISYAGGGD